MEEDNSDAPRRVHNEMNRTLELGNIKSWYDWYGTDKKKSLKNCENAK